MIGGPGPPADATLRTRRLRYRRFDGSDLDDVVALDSDPRVMRYLENGRPQPAAHAAEELDRLRAHNGRQDQLGYWAASDEEGFVGWFTATPQPDSSAMLGYRLRSEVWGRGYATEGAQLMIELARSAGCPRVVATTMAVNHGSRRVLEKVGLELVRTWLAEWAEPIPGAELGDVDYALTLG